MKSFLILLGHDHKNMQILINAVLHEVKMPCFDDLFIESKGQLIQYAGKTLILDDKFPVSNGEELIVNIEEVNEKRRQEFAIDITGHCEINGKVAKKGKRIIMLYWADTEIGPSKIKIFTKELTLRKRDRRIESVVVHLFDHFAFLCVLYLDFRIFSLPLEQKMINVFI